jgi:hypothetical protein
MNKMTIQEDGHMYVEFIMPEEQLRPIGDNTYMQQCNVCLTGNQFEKGDEYFTCWNCGVQNKCNIEG